MVRTLPQSRLSRVLEHLKREPLLALPNVTALKLKLALRNDHFGARHFAKDELPRVRYANPELHIEVTKVMKRKDEQWEPELQLHHQDGSSQTLSLAHKWSSTIVRELMDLAGGSSWERWKAHARETGLSVVPGEENAGKPVADVTKTRWQFLPPTLQPPWKVKRAQAFAEKKGEGGAVVGELSLNAQAQTENGEEKADYIVEEAPKVKALSGPGAILRSSEKPKTLRGPAADLA